MNQYRLKRGFDFLAPFYNFLVKVFFGNSITRVQIHFLPEIKKAKSVLIFGGGTGEILAHSFKINSTADYTYLDISAKMISLAKQKTNAIINVKFIEGSYQDINQQSFDVIITPFVLDCFSNNQLKEVVFSLKSNLSKDGKWLFSDFNHSTGSAFMQLVSKWLIRSLYGFFNIFCSLGFSKLPDFESIFNENAFQKSNETLFLKQILVSRVYVNK